MRWGDRECKVGREKEKECEGRYCHGEGGAATGEVDRERETKKKERKRIEGGKDFCLLFLFF